MDKEEEIIEFSLYPLTMTKYYITSLNITKYIMI